MGRELLRELSLFVTGYYMVTRLNVIELLDTVEIPTGGNL
jgi:hypothetical protein